MGVRGDTELGALRALPAVHKLAAQLDAPHALAVRAARRAISEARGRGDPPDLEAISERARELVVRLTRPSLRGVINASGVIIHTNLGRAPLPQSARQALATQAAGYCNLELDLESGDRGNRAGHVARLLVELTGAEAATVVNNGAAAVLLAAAALGGRGRSIIVSRGQLVEIGGGFRIPEVIAQSGAQLIEVGTTNRTRLSDYRRAAATAGDELGAILRVHQSNFRALGFVEDVPVHELCGLGPPVIDDVGSGVLADAAHLPALADEPAIADSVSAGASLVCCSGDKLLGGPQAGLLVGRREAVIAAREHPLARALRIDKLSLVALEATLLLYLDPHRALREVPVLAMLSVSEEELRRRAGRLREVIGEQRSEVVRAIAKVGGGALPLAELEGPAVALRADRGPSELATALRVGNPSVIARINDGCVLLDPRTLAPEEVEMTGAAVRRTLDRE